MRITYFLDGTTTQLGSEGSEGITEVLYPDSNYNSHEITITKMFEGYPHHRWQVITVDHPSESEISISLKPRITKATEVYLSQTHKHKKSVISNLQKGTLVEIDYGYIPSIKKSSGVLRSNKRYPDARQNGEMHKRRLAVVVNASGKRIQVVPISSNEPPIGDRSCFSLDKGSIEKLVHYNSKDM
ncbi:MULTISPECIES: hypothetical protein [unclassified Pseudoalteromonas]|uniref:hypothetical protein n=1 Tax=unclassified Pseudoalteromonas TaxID=194690 RepID=UPI000AEFE062|nr:MULTISPECIES: hypothetical protein [unclassified Pseudoalteromonas]